MLPVLYGLIVGHFMLYMYPNVWQPKLYVLFCTLTYCMWAGYVAMGRLGIFSPVSEE